MGSDKSNESDEKTRERILAPDDLDITRQPEVEEIDEGRYVVSPNGPAKKPNRDLLENPDWLDEPDDSEVDKETAPQPSTDQPPETQGRSSQSTPSEQSATDTQPGGQSTPGNQSTPKRQPSHNQSADGQSTGGSPSRSQPASTSNGGQSSSSTQSTPQSTNSGNQSPPNTQSTSGSQPRQPPSQTPSTSSSQSTDDTTPQPSQTDLAAHDQPPVEPPAVEFTNENVSKFLAASLAESSGDYGFDATINIEGQVKRGQMTSDDIGETLETLLRWYAKQTTDEIEPEAVLGIILAGSDLAVEYPVQSAYSMLKRHGLKPDDSIGDLLAAVREEGSFTVPPSNDR